MKRKARPASVSTLKTMTTYRSLPSVAHLLLTNSHGRGRSHWKAMAKMEKMAQPTIVAAKPMTALRFMVSESIRPTRNNTAILAKN